MTLPPIETDELDPTRQYIPLPGGWEIQTKGKGSSYRLLNRNTGERQPILGGEPKFIQDFVTQMALDVRKAVDAQTGRAPFHERSENGNKLPVSGKIFPADLIDKLEALCSPAAEAMPDGERLTQLVRAGQAVIDALRPHQPPIQLTDNLTQCGGTEHWSPGGVTQTIRRLLDDDQVR